MKKSVKIDLAAKSSSDLEKRLVELQKELVETKVKHHLGQIKDTSVFQKRREEFATIKQLLANKQNEQSK